MNANTVKKVLVVGSGVMGSSIVQIFATADIDVVLVDVDQKILTRAMGLIESSLTTLADFGKIFKDKIPSILSRIKPSTNLTEMAGDVDFIIEAVPEVPNIKKKVFSQLDELCPPDTIIASNTSALDIFSIADVKRPERLVIAYFSHQRTSSPWSRSCRVRGPCRKPYHSPQPLWKGSVKVH
jgi:3-hydroxyacyl-CoA dehydrogenase